ncbi:hypothetical protein ACFFK0_29025 [Paenibacillus chartarius]|uniref:Aldolase n=1 Tax=Paenibacillus chartarius TaxID=747481 RepID=A0ABV6DUV4_9BACL
MTIIHTRIGEHRVELSCPSGELAEFFQTNYILSGFRPDEAPDIRLQIEPGYGVPFRDYDVGVEHSAGLTIYTRADYRIEAEPSYRKARLLVHNAFALKHALVHFYSAYVVHTGWGLVLHASSAVDGGAAHLFTGPSGAGKSTAARLSQPRLLLSDEAAIVKLAEDGVFVYDSPFRSDISSGRLLTPYPLGSVHILHQAPAHERKAVRKPDAFLKLMDKIFYWPSNARDTSRVLGQLKKLADNADVYDLYFQKNDQFWELIS